MNTAQCELHEWLEQHQTDIQRPATRYGELHQSCTGNLSVPFSKLSLHCNNRFSFMKRHHAGRSFMKRHHAGRQFRSGRHFTALKNVTRPSGRMHSWLQS